MLRSLSDVARYYRALALMINMFIRKYRKVRTENAQNRGFLLGAAFFKPIMGVAGKIKGFFSRLQPFFHLSIGIVQDLFQADFLFDEFAFLFCILLVGKQTAIGVQGRDFELEEVVQFL